MQFLKTYCNRFIDFFKNLKAKTTSRKIRLLSNKIVLNLIRLAITLLLLLIGTSYYIYFHNPKILNKIKYNSLSALSRITTLDYKKFEITINGAQRSDREEISKIIYDKYKGENQINSLDNLENLIKEIKKSQKWIDSIHIFRLLPNDINVEIEEFSPFAIWENGNKSYVIDNNGNKVIINSSEEFESLIILSGANAYTHVKSLFNIMVINPEISSRIYSAIWVGNRRWDLRLDSSLLIKLPSSNINEQWNQLVNLYNTKGSFYNLKVIDLRVKNKIYLEYKNRIN